MFGTAQLTDDLVAAAIRGCPDDASRIMEMISPQVRLMVTARLSPNPSQFHAVEELRQLSMVALADGLTRIRTPTVAGLKSYLRGIVSRKVADYLNRRGEGGRAAADTESLDAPIADPDGATGAGPLWQLLSASGASPASAAAQAEQINNVMSEIGRLKAEHRQVITMAFFDQIPTRQIAEELEVSRPAASMLLIRAVKALRRNLTGSSRIVTP